MQQIETDGISLKTELMEPNVDSHPLIFIEPSGTAPLASTSAQIITTSQPTVARPKVLKRVRSFSTIEMMKISVLFRNYDFRYQIESQNQHRSLLDRLFDRIQRRQFQRHI